MRAFFVRNRQIFVLVLVGLVVLAVSYGYTYFTERGRAQVQYYVAVPVLMISEPKTVNGMYARVIKIEWDPVSHRGQMEKFYFPADDYQEVQSDRNDGICLLTMIEKGSGPYFVVNLPKQGRLNCPSTE